MRNREKMQAVYDQIVEQIKESKNLTFVSGTTSSHKSYSSQGCTAHNFNFFINKGSLSVVFYLNFEEQKLQSGGLKNLATNEFIISFDEGPEENISATLKMLNDCNFKTKRKSISFSSFFEKPKQNGYTGE